MDLDKKRRNTMLLPLLSTMHKKLMMATLQEKISYITNDKTIIAKRYIVLIAVLFGKDVKFL